MRSNLKFLLFPVLLSLVCSCASIDSQFSKFEGRNIEEIINKLGYPEEKREILGKTIYKWKSGTEYGHYCNLDIVVDANNTVVSGQYNGTRGGCLYFGQRLN